MELNKTANAWVKQSLKSSLRNLLRSCKKYNIDFKEILREVIKEYRI